MSRYRLVCLECWEPFTADEDDAALCSWCAATPAERRRKLIRNAVLLVLGTGLLIVALCLMPGGRP